MSSKYLEELYCGNFFELENKKYILTTDFKKNNDRLCINLETGSPQWIKSNSIISELSLYTLDNNQNFSPLKIKHNEPPSSIKNNNIY